MQTILVVNPKGGSGKSTLSTNLAGFFACWGVRVTLIDCDEQASALEWLAARPACCPEINGISAANGESQVRPDSDYTIVDVPSGLDTDLLLPWLRRADRVIIPIVPSPHDIRASKKFIDWIATNERLESRLPFMGIIANRVKANTRSFRLIEDFLPTMPVDCFAILRDTQNYVMAAQNGLSIFELPNSQVHKDLEQWTRLVKWLCADPYISIDVPIKPQAHSLSSC